jgi:hypothetical protein
MEKQYMDLGAVQQELLKACTGDKIGDMKDLFLWFHGRELQKYKGPWFLPGYLCGLGLQGNVTSHDKQKARGLKILYQQGQKVPTIPGDKSCHIWDYCAEEIRERYPLSSDLPYRGIDGQWSQVPHLLHIWGLEGVSGLFRSVFPFSFKSRYSKIVTWRNTNLRLWKKASTKHGMEKSIDPEPKKTVMNIVNVSDKVRYQPERQLGPYKDPFYGCKYDLNDLRSKVLTVRRRIVENFWEKVFLPPTD